MEEGGYQMEGVNWRVVLQERGEREHVQEKRHVDTLVTARPLQASPRIQDKSKRERDIALLPITLERMEWFYYMLDNQIRLI